MDTLRSAVTSLRAVGASPVERSRNGAAHCLQSSSLRFPAAIGKCRHFGRSSWQFSTTVRVGRSTQTGTRCNYVTAAIAVPAEKSKQVEEIVLPLVRDISGTIKLPGSKSLSNRVLLLAALAEVGQSTNYDPCILFLVPRFSKY